MNTIKKNNLFHWGFLFLVSIILIQCDDKLYREDHNQSVSIEFDMRLPIDSNGYYHLELKKDPNSWQTVHRVDGIVTDEQGNPLFYRRIEWESNLYWYLGDTLGYIVKRGLSDDVVYVSYDTVYVTVFDGMEVPTTNIRSYSNDDGEISNMIAPVKTMQGDTLLLKAYHNDIYTTFGIVLD